MSDITESVRALLDKSPFINMLDFMKYFIFL